MLSSRAGSPLDHRPVHRNRVAGTHAQPVAFHDVFERRVVFRAIGQDAPRGLGREVEKRADRVTGAFAGSQFQHLANKDQRYDHHRRLEICADALAHSILFGEKPGRNVAKIE